MFTGLIETLGKIKKIHVQNQGCHLEIEAPVLASALKTGDSVATNGVCLTVVKSNKSGFEAQAVGVTLEKTTLGGLKRGTWVNLERALKADGRLDGHLVSGHVNGLGLVQSFTPWGLAWVLTLEVPGELSSQIFKEGSLCVDGISLTVSAITPRGCELNIIPHTKDHTNLKYLIRGQKVNLETDMLTRNTAPRPSTRLSLEALRCWGY